MTTPQTNVVGVFEDTERADQAVAALRQAGFGEDQLVTTTREEAGDVATAAEGRPREVEAPGRIVVTVQADQRHAEVASVLHRHGARDTQWVAR